LCWALEQDRFQTKATAVEYGDSVSGVPLVKSLVYWQEGRFNEPFFTSTIKEIVPGAPPDSVFSTAEFGLPDLPRPKGSGFPILTVLGVAGLGAGLFLAWLAYRRADLQHKVS
jgi:hypothetical protein